MNEFYSAPNSPVDFTVAKSIQIRQQWEALEQAFDRLNGRISFLVAGGTANALTVTMDFPPEAYEEGLMFHAKIATTNTGAATMNVNGLGAVAILGRDGTALAAGDLVADSVETFFYVEGAFRIRAVEGAQGPQGPMGDVEEAPIDGTTYARKDGGWVAAPAGPAGADGKTVLNGAGAPGAGLGTDGDFYIDTTADAIYGPKAAGAWGAATSLIGPQGPQGIQGVQGVQGVQGPQGATGPAGADGADGAGSTWADLGGKPPELVSLAALAGVADKIPYFSGVDTFALTDITALGRSILAAADAAALANIVAGGMLTINDVSLTSPGWLRINCGAAGVFTIMWGTANIAANGSTTVNYPDGGFSSFSVAVCSAPGKIDNNAQDNGPAVSSAGAASFQVWNAWDTARTTQWIAVGK